MATTLNRAATAMAVRSNAGRNRECIAIVRAFLTHKGLRVCYACCVSSPSPCKASAPSAD
jgi:hypothetical protein